MRRILRGMKYIEKDIQDRLRTATHKELLGGESLFMADIASVLTPEAIADGVSIEFGSNKYRFEQTLELLGVDDHLKRGTLDIIHATVGSPASMHTVAPNRVKSVTEESHFTLDEETQLGLLRTLEYMHAESWRVEKPGGYAHFSGQSMSSVTSKAILGKATQSDRGGDAYVELRHPIIGVSVSADYMPAETDEYGHMHGELPYRMADFAEKSEPRVFQQLAESHGGEGLQLHLPNQTYRLEVSLTPAQVQSTFMSSVTPRVRQAYIVEDDRLRHFIHE